MNYLYLIIIILLVILLICLLSYKGNDLCYNKSNYNEKDRNNLIELWMQHLIYTRLVFMAYFDDSSNLKQLEERLMNNQKDIGKLFSKIYSNKVGNAVTNLLTEHVEIAVKVLASLKNGNENEQREAIKAFYANANEIGVLIDKLKNTETFKNHMKMHIDTLMSTVTSYTKKNYEKDIVDFDKYIHGGLMMATDLFVL